MKTDSTLLTVFTVARMLGKAPTTIRQYEADGKLRAIRSSAGDRLFWKDEVDRFLAERKSVVK